MKTLTFLFSLLALTTSNSLSQTYFLKVFGAGTYGKYLSQNIDGNYIVTLDSTDNYGCIVDDIGNVILKKKITYGSKTIEQLSNGNYIIASTVIGNFGFNIATLITTNSVLDSITSINFPSNQNGSRASLAIPTKDNNIIFCYWDDGPLHGNTGFVKKLNLSGNVIWTSTSGTSEVPTSGIIQDHDSNFVWVISDWTNIEFFTFNKKSNQGTFGITSTISDTSFCFCFNDNLSICDLPNSGYIAGTIYNQSTTMIRLDSMLDTLWTKRINIISSPISIVQDNNNGVMVLSDNAELLNLDTNGNLISYSSIFNLNIAFGNKMIKSDDGAFVTVGTLYDSSSEPHAFLAKTNQFGSTTNIKNTSPSSEIKIYPNPAHDHIEIVAGNNFLNPSPLSLIIKNIMGTTVFSSSLPEQFRTVDLTSLSLNGIYFIYVMDDNQHLVDVKKIVIQ